MRPADSVTLPIVLEAILLDLDGTLYRQTPVRTGMSLRLARHILFHPITGVRTARFLRAYRIAQEELRTANLSSGGEAQMRRACARISIPESEAQRLIEHWMQTLPLDLIVKAARPGLRSFLEAATARGIRLGIVSDYPAEEKLAALDIRHHFSVVVSAADGEVRRFKPAPDGIHAAVRALGIEISKAVYVGDRPGVDAEAARRAGIASVIMADNKHLASDVPVVESFADLQRLLAI